MLISNEEAYTFYLDKTKNIPAKGSRNERFNTVASMFIEENSLTESLSLISKRFSRLIESKPNNKCVEEKHTAWKKKIFLTVAVTAARTTARNPVGRKQSTLGDQPCKKTARTILKTHVDAIEKYATDQKITREDALAQIVTECKRLWKMDNEEEKYSMSVTDATALMYNLDLPVSKYQVLRTSCLPYNIVFPTRNAIDKIKSTLHPPILSQELKASVDMKELLDTTAIALLKLDSEYVLQEDTIYTVVGKFGVDGSGSHKIRQQLVNYGNALAETPHLDPSKTSNFLLSCYCPLEITDGKNNIIWKNTVPNSTTFARPVSLSRATEEREILSAELDKPFDLIRDSVTTENEFNGKTITLHFRTECSMVDGKMVSLLQGDSGAFCHLCSTTKVEANTMENIANGFTINKSYDTCHEAWDKLQSGEILYSSKERQGQCHPTIAKSSLHFFSILHFKLRSLDFVQKILYHLVSGQKVWSESGNLVSRFIEAAKDNCIDHIRDTTGMLMDSPCGNLGNTNSGPLADRFFSEVNREHICELILNTEDRENYSTLLSLFNIMLAVTQSVNVEKKVNTDAVKSLGIELMSHIKNCFLDNNGNSWITIIPTVHQNCAHAWELFHMNSGKSIAKWSESPLESWNKYVQSYQSGVSCRARQLSIRNNIYDIFR